MRLFHSLGVIALLVAFNTAQACTNFLITKGATVDGSNFISYCADSHIRYGELYFTPSADWPAGSMRVCYDRGTNAPRGSVPQPPHTYQVVGYINENQVALGETTFGGREELMDPTGIVDYGSLMFIALERSRSAREAIKVIAELMDTYGYASEGESFSIVDPEEAWIMELIGKGEKMLDAKGKVVKGWSNGAVWVARRIPDGYVSGHANQSRISTFPLRDGKTSITSKELDKIFLPSVETVYAYDVISFARLKGLYPKDVKAAPDAEFSFCDTYAPVDFGAARFCEARVWAFFNRCNPTEMAQYEDYARGDNLKHRFPLWIKPSDKSKIDVRFMMAAMRDHFEGTSMDMTKDLGAGPYQCPYRWRPMTWSYNGKDYIHERATATQQTGFSFVAQCRNWLPNKVGGIFWFSVDDAASTCYVPMYCGITKIPHEYEQGNGSMVEYSPTAAFWTFTKVSNFVYSRYNDMIKHVNEKQDFFENRFIRETIDMGKKLAELQRNDPDNAQKRINEYSMKAAKEVCQAWNDLFIYLLVKYHDGNIKKEENGKFKVSDTKIPQCAFPDQPEYPQYWYKMIVDDCGKNIEAK